MLPTAQYTVFIKRRAAELGFMYCGISKAEFLEEEAPRLENWLNRQMNGKMAYMANHFDKRLDPRLHAGHLVRRHPLRGSGFGKGGSGVHAGWFGLCLEWQGRGGRARSIAAGAPGDSLR